MLMTLIYRAFVHTLLILTKLRKGFFNGNNRFFDFCFFCKVLSNHVHYQLFEIFCFLLPFDEKLRRDFETTKSQGTFLNNKIIKKYKK